MNSEFEDSSYSKSANSGVCQILHQLLNEKGNHRQKPELLIVNKNTLSPLSLDGTGNPTVFSLERYDPDTLCYVFSYEDELNGTTPYESVIGTYTTDCHSIAGIIRVG